MEQLKKELGECKEADPTGRKNVMEFMQQNGIRHISELDYPFRKQFQKWLQERGYADATVQKYLIAYDRVKQHSAQQSQLRIVGGKQAVPADKNEIFFLSYHPDPKIAKRFKNAIKKEDLVWNFSRKAPERLKRQIYEILHYAIYMEASEETTRTSLLGLRELYDFCTGEGTEDIEQMEQEQARQFAEKEGMRLSPRKRLIALNFCRKALFMQGSEIHWHVHVWYMERMHLQPERVDRARPVEQLSFLEVTNQRNRELLKQYARYGLGLTNLSVSSLRKELNCIRSFLAGLGQGEAGDVCMITQKDMDGY